MPGAFFDPASLTHEMEVQDRRTVFSPDRSYRYTLWREWGIGALPLFSSQQSPDAFVTFIGLNPSTADETRDDPTIRKCIGFAKRWGFGAICMTNLFAFRATDPRDMQKASDPIGPDNNKWLSEIGRIATLIIAAWGTRGDFMGRHRYVRRMFDNLQCLRLTKGGNPEHPLYVPYETKTVPYKLPF